MSDATRRRVASEVPKTAASDSLRGASCFSAGESENRVSRPRRASSASSLFEHFDAARASRALEPLVISWGPMASSDALSRGAEAHAPMLNTRATCGADCVELDRLRTAQIETVRRTERSTRGGCASTGKGGLAYTRNAPRERIPSPSRLWKWPPLAFARRE